VQAPKGLEDGEEEQQRCVRWHESTARAGTLTSL